LAHLVNLLDSTPLEKSAIYNLKSLELWHRIFGAVKLRDHPGYFLDAGVSWSNRVMDSMRSQTPSTKAQDFWCQVSGEKSERLKPEY
jgi:hypothetical protein